MSANIEMSEDFWGKYTSEEPVTHFDPLHTFMDEDTPVGFRVNFVPGRRHRPREQKLKLEASDLDEPINVEEITNSPLYRVYKGIEPGIVIAGDTKIINRPTDDATTSDYSSFRGLTVMNKYSPLGLFTKQATGIAMVSFPSKYIRKLTNPQLNYDLLLPMQTSLKYIVEDKKEFKDYNTPLVFFNIGPSSGASIRYLHGQSYVIPEPHGLNTFGYRKSFEANTTCLACKIANNEWVVDHLSQEINYRALTIWEDENIRLIYPHAPLRTLGTRLIPKHHITYLGDASIQMLQSIAKGLAIADYVMNEALPRSRKIIVDRTVSFRQTSKIGRDFHMFIDVLPPFPFVASETVDFLGLSPFVPVNMAELMRNVKIDHITTSFVD